MLLVEEYRNREAYRVINEQSEIWPAIHSRKFSLCTDWRRLKITDIFVSRLLARVDLKHATLKYRALDFSRCPALEQLDMLCCRVHVDNILSQSLRQLSITECDFGRSTRCRISAPCLTSLQLVVSSGRAPFLDEMPLLLTANVRLGDWSCADICVNNRYYGDCGDGNCRGCFGSRGDGSSVLLLRLVKRHGHRNHKLP
ncbi:hypothetical protein HU200_016714 [Digitaria exilis]|uniref:Uncharacterized protein n=1 Tax=Digitaria exilis TaxID=1010633 RepID=A0A835F7M1_9POAL|nr:hypothetical protein HU200_016714 [Digitaria exilis]